MQDMVKLYKIDYPHDVRQIQCAVIKHGYHCTKKDADQLWRLYSRSFCAQWLNMIDWSDDAIWEAVAPFVEEDYDF